MSFWFASLVLIAICAGFILWPLRGTKAAPLERKTSALAIFTDQLAEVDRDMARGLISEGEADAARAEIKRRMIAADKDEGGRADTGAGLWGVVAMAVLVPLGGAGVYTLTGAPDVPSMPFAERQDEQDDATEVNTLITTLRTRLLEDPQGGETRGWELLAATLMNRNRYAEAVEAWEQIVDREDATSATWSQYAEALISVENGVVTQAAERAIERSLELDPFNPAATFYQAVTLDQAGQTIDGRNLLLARMAQETTEQPWMPFFLQEINRMGEGFGLDPLPMPDFPDAPERGPSAADIQAASEMTDEERQEFIRGMVGRLADRLEDEPEDLEGWLQLARAYAVLGERDNVVSALTSAEPLIADLPEDDARRIAVEQGLAQFRP